MWVRSTSQIAHPFSKYVAQSRICSRLTFARTAAIQFSPILSHVTKSLECNQFVRSLSVSSPVSLQVTKWTCDGSEHDNKVGCSVASVNTPKNKVNQAERLKRAVKEYGATVIVFHTCISLFTLGVAYTAVSSGLDVVGLLGKVGVGQSLMDSKIATGASTFVVAYAVHKVFAPVRMATTLAVTPLIVRHLRRIGFLKQPATKV